VENDLKRERSISKKNEFVNSTNIIV